MTPRVAAPAAATARAGSEAAVQAGHGSVSATAPHTPVTRLRLEPAPEALVFRSACEGFERIAVPDVHLHEGDLLVRVELATVCGSDRHTAAGLRHESTPLVLGHEQVGRIIAVGPGALPRSVDDRPLAIGDRIVWAVAVSCGTCARCRSGLENKCLHLRKYGHTRTSRGWELTGGFATHVHVVAGSAVVKVPEDLPAAVAAPASCATATVVAALDAAAALRPVDGGIVVVSGCGMLGLTAVALARAAGATVIGVDPDPERRRQAMLFGAAEAVAPGREALASAVSRASSSTDADGFTVALELSGAGSAIVDLLATAGVGAAIVLVGSVFPAAPVPVSAEDVVRRLLTITGVHNYRPEHLLRAVAFLRAADHALFGSLVEKAITMPELPAAISAPSAAARIAVRP
ncbi:alcohol dehydrogenase catalytic domain-containing protein [uncultured Microbacterium sp.]|uniref:alcohol dehydrogenase catalytic domain-containing protein n=1 Tax=uncultured Microbacterium sp. TaxID=191216 RepID=UPI002607F7A6|nr:alcohol dehydrogenase catalytic domain-containing protein [uncultured Microbacterium sp.]